MKSSRICELFGIEYPIIAGGILRRNVTAAAFVLSAKQAGGHGSWK